MSRSGRDALARIPRAHRAARREARADRRRAGASRRAAGRTCEPSATPSVGGTDPGALVQLANADARPADAVLIDAGWLQNEAATTLVESLFSARNVPCVTMRERFAARARRSTGCSKWWCERYCARSCERRSPVRPSQVLKFRMFCALARAGPGLARYRQAMKPTKSLFVLALLLVPGLAAAQGYYGGGGPGYCSQPPARSSPAASTTAGPPRVRRQHRPRRHARRRQQHHELQQLQLQPDRGRGRRTHRRLPRRRASR